MLSNSLIRPYIYTFIFLSHQRRIYNLYPYSLIDYILSHSLCHLHLICLPPQPVFKHRPSSVSVLCDSLSPRIKLQASLVSFNQEQIPSFSRPGHFWRTKAMVYRLSLNCYSRAFLRSRFQFDRNTSEVLLCPPRVLRQGARDVGLFHWWQWELILGEGGVCTVSPSSLSLPLMNILPVGRAAATGSVF